MSDRSATGANACSPTPQALPAVSDKQLGPMLRALLADTGEFPRPVATFVLPESMWPLIETTAARLKPSAVLLAILLDQGPARIVLTRRAEHLRQHKGQISLPGGRRDDTDMSYAATALREADEEIGMPVNGVEVIGYLEDVPTLTGYRITPVVGLVHAPFEARPHAGEVAEIIELPLDLVLYGERFQRKPLERFGVTYPTHEIHYNGHRIWGATAAILWNLRQKFDAWLAHGDANRWLNNEADISRENPVGQLAEWSNATASDLE